MFSLVPAHTSRIHELVRCSAYISPRYIELSTLARDSSEVFKLKI